MMKIKHFYYCFLFIIIVFACSNQQEKARIYHDSIISTIHKVFDSVTKTEEIFEQSDTALVEKQLLQLEFELNKANADINKIAPYKNDSTLKTVALNLINFYKNTVILHYQTALTRMKETKSTSKNDMVLGLSIFSTYFREDSLTAEFEKEDSLFISKYLKEK